MALGYHGGADNRVPQLPQTYICFDCSPKKLVDASAAMYYNNLACIHMMMRKHDLGSFYFKKALTENENLAKELKLETLGMCSLIRFLCLCSCLCLCLCLCLCFEWIKFRSFLLR